MRVKSHFFLAIVGMLLVPILTSASDSSNTKEIQNSYKVSNRNDSSRPMSLVYLGVVDGISYFIEPNVTMNWTDAKVYCENANLKLASVVTKRQAEFLYNATIPYGNKEYWSSLHEALAPQMMVWDGTLNAPNVTVLKHWSWSSYTGGYQYCGFFSRGSDLGELHIRGTWCTRLDILVACQS